MMMMRSRIGHIVFWGIIAAAFIGPGTVTTAVQAGNSYGVSLLWALTFATFATIILQEASARITISSGMNLGQAISLKYSGKKGASVRYFVAGSIILGGAAYQAGNILGAVSGLGLNFNMNQNLLTILIVIVAGILLWTGNTKQIANTLGLVVAAMGVLFLGVAIRGNPAAGEVLYGMIIPAFPESSGLLIIGLLGTTIVPYNLFLAAGVAKGQTMSQMRFGLTWAVIIGGLISMAILLVGSQVKGPFSFESLSLALENNLGSWASIFFGFGLFAAGFTSAVTAPLASAITIQTVIPGATVGSRQFNAVWIFVLSIGLLFGVSGVKPIPVIILAQALNGLLLPFVTILIFRIINEKKVMREEHLNGLKGNIFLVLICGITTFLGFNNVSKALISALGISIPGQQHIILLIAISLLVCLWLVIGMVRKHNY